MKTFYAFILILLLMATCRDCHRSDLKDVWAVRIHARTCPKRGASVHKAIARRDLNLGNVKAAKISRQHDEDQYQLAKHRAHLRDVINNQQV